ncbi:MAG: B12-binding domain-containing protein, partial [Pseudomonadota bacterium]
MSALSLHDSPLVRDLYDRSRIRILTLKRALPDEVVEPIAREVLRRVVAARPETAVPAAADREKRISELCQALIAEDDRAAFEFIEQRRVEGASLENVYLDDLSEAARALGRLWDDDRISFVEVTLGTSRIYAIMRAMSPRFHTPAKINRRSAVFASVPGETHTLGIDMAADLFRQDGWEIILKTG